MRKVRTARAASSSKIRAVSDEDLGRVAGGMKWVSGVKNSDVIDARGGKFDFGPITVTLDKSGKVSSVTLR